MYFRSGSTKIHTLHPLHTNQVLELYETRKVSKTVLMVSEGKVLPRRGRVWVRWVGKAGVVHLLEGQPEGVRGCVRP